jgi:hypothetical protein
VYTGSRPKNCAGTGAGANKEREKKKKDGLTYQARQADLTGGAANFFLDTPVALGPALALACGAATEGAAASAAGISAMTGFAGSLESIRRRWLSGTGRGWTEIIRSAYARGVKGNQSRRRGRAGAERRRGGPGPQGKGREEGFFWVRGNEINDGVPGAGCWWMLDAGRLGAMGWDGIRRIG